jgi:hypothetical protein
MFEFPIHGRPADLETARRDRKPFSATSDGRLYRPGLYLRVTSVGLPRRSRWVIAQVDTGADCCVFPQKVAEDLGLLRRSETHEVQLRTGAGLVVAWFAEVQLHLGLPSEPYEFDWTAMVGFVRDDVLPPAFPFGIFGLGGGLEQFLRIELVLAPGMAEMPVVRVSTPST